MLHLLKICTCIPPKKHLHQPHLLLCLHDLLRNCPSPTLQLFPLIIKYAKVQGVPKEDRENCAFTPLQTDLSLMWARLVRDNLVVRSWPKSRTYIPKRFGLQAHYYYHIDVLGHKNEDCRELRRKMQDLMDEECLYFTQ